MSNKKYDDISYNQAELIIKSLEEYKTKLDPAANKNKINEINIMLAEIDNDKRLFKMMKEVKSEIKNISKKLNNIKIK